MENEAYVRFCVSGLTIITAALGGACCFFLKFNTKLATHDELKNIKIVESP